MIGDSPKNHCAELFEFHQWRRTKVSKLLEKLDQGLFDKQLQGSFGSLFVVLNHLVWAEKVWLNRVAENEVAAMRKKDQSVQSLLKEWETVSEKWSQLIEAKTPAEFEKPIFYFNTRGEKFENTLFEIVVHLVDHSTYHIGQMMNAVRAFGLEPVSTNVIHYLRATSDKG